MPVTYPHVLAFPLALDLMTRATFPFSVLGLVHITNEIRQERAIGGTDRLDLLVSAGNLRPHERGTTVDIVTTASDGRTYVWH